MLCKVEFSIEPPDLPETTRGWVMGEGVVLSLFLFSFVERCLEELYLKISREGAAHSGDEFLFMNEGQGWN